ncbi:hypothetical protein E5675_15280 [Sphingopyxis sp. PAMC25046]|uniref:hypothetical protein n=1 Tax=Sphingopyxis sp. PAMC25046 TaxID=2565556 RepID=UPI00109DBD9E|nr:hypothetical protein [Sphingopyxis sp. PAMC25046]QCB55661.1 hypothetical protein E5675_15280 [Sphingopyxis sp. PAMC25046]
MSARIAYVMIASAPLALWSDPGAARDARWTMRAVDAQGRDEAGGCAAARVRAAAEARKYLGLNIGRCVCVPIASKGDGPTAGYRCRLTYEVLVRSGSQ